MCLSDRTGGPQRGGQAPAPGPRDVPQEQSFARAMLERGQQQQQQQQGPPEAFPALRCQNAATVPERIFDRLSRSPFRTIHQKRYPSRHKRRHESRRIAKVAAKSMSECEHCRRRGVPTPLVQPENNNVVKQPAAEWSAMTATVT